MTHHIKPKQRHTSRRVASLVALLAATLLCSGCETLLRTPQVDLVDPVAYKAPAPTAPAPQTATVPANGSLFTAASYRPGFEDRRPRMAGDIVIIQITENLEASQSSTSTVERSANVSYSVTGLPIYNGAAILGKLGAGAANNNSMDGSGETESTNTFTGTITTTVLDVLPNGHLVVTGEKQIGVNKNVDVLKFSGTVDPRFVLPNGTVNSSQVANVRVESRGRGQAAEVQAIGWLARFFLTFMPF